MGRNHIGRESLGQIPPQLLRRGVVVHDAIGDKLDTAPAIGSLRDDLDRGDSRMLREDALDLSRLDAISTDLNLVVVSSDVDQFAVGKVLGEIAGSEKSIACMEWAGYEPAFALIRPIQIAPGDP
jgi:hypothetical protein